MMTAPIRTVALVLAAGGLALSAPASAAPAAHARAWSQAAPVYGDLTAQHHRRGHQRGWEKHRRDDDDRRYRDSRDYRGYENYSGYRQSYQAQPSYNNYPSNYGEPVYQNTRVWQGDDGRYYCRKSNGTTGLLIGGAVGALLGREVVGRNGDRTLGAILGAAGGALLGKSLDSKTRCG